MPPKKVTTPVDELNYNIKVATGQMMKPGHGVLKNTPTSAPSSAKPKVKPGSYVKPGGKATGSMKDYPLYSQARRDEYTARGWKQDATTKVKRNEPLPKMQTRGAVDVNTGERLNVRNEAMLAGTGNKSVAKTKGDVNTNKAQTKIKGDKTTTIGSGNTKKSAVNIGSGNNKGDKTKIKVGKGASINIIDQSSDPGTASSLPTKYGVNSGQVAPAIGSNITSSTAKRSAAAADKTQVTNNTNVNKIAASTAKGSGTPTTGNMNSISSRTTMPTGGGSGMGQISAVKNEMASLASKFGPASASSQSNIGTMTTKVENSPKSPVKKEAKTSLDMEKDLLASLEKNNPDRFM